MLAEQREGVPRAAAVAEIERELLRLYRDPALTEKPALLEQRGGAFYSEAATGLVASLAAGTGDVHVVDVRNRGTLAGLADDDVVEVPARVDRDGPAPLAQRPLAPELLGLVQHVTAYERLAVQAASAAIRWWRGRRCSRTRSSGSTPSPRSCRAAARRRCPTCRSSRARGRRAGHRVVLAVDGGNSKTHLALVRANGEVLALVLGPQSLAAPLGLEGCLAVLEDLLAEAVRQSGLVERNGTLADVGELLLAGVDSRPRSRSLGARPGPRLGRDDRRPQRHLRHPPAPAPSAAGAWRWCAAPGSTASASRRTGGARFPSLGSITGTGAAATTSAWRRCGRPRAARTGRGPQTSLERLVPAHFGLDAPSELAEAFHRGRFEQRRVIELAPLVVREAAADDIAAEIVDRLVGEVVAMARVALTRLGLEDEPVEVARRWPAADGDCRLVERICEGLSEVGPEITVRSTKAPAIVGAALLGLDAVGADGPAQARLREELAAAVEQVEAGGRKVATGG